MRSQERYSPVPLGANGSYTLSKQGIAGFLPTVSGTITIVNGEGTTVLNAYPVSAGVFARIPMFLKDNHGTVTLAGGAAGTLLIQ